MWLSDDASVLAYMISSSGSDWQTIYALRVRVCLRVGGCGWVCYVNHITHTHIAHTLHTTHPLKQTHTHRDVATGQPLVDEVHWCKFSHTYTHTHQGRGHGPAAGRRGALVQVLERGLDQGWERLLLRALPAAVVERQGGRRGHRDGGGGEPEGR